MHSRPGTRRAFRATSFFADGPSSHLAGVFPRCSSGGQRGFSSIVVEGQAHVFDETPQCLPVVQRVADSDGHRTLRRMLVLLLVEPLFEERADEWAPVLAQFLMSFGPDDAPLFGFVLDAVQLEDEFERLSRLGSRRQAS